MYDELKRLNFEDFIWILFATLAFLNIFGNYNSKEYIITNNGKYKYQSNKVFEFTLTITLLIYGYFFIRNYNSFINGEDYGNVSLYSNWRNRNERACKVSAGRRAYSIRFGYL